MNDRARLAVSKPRRDLLKGQFGKWLFCHRDAPFSPCKITQQSARLTLAPCRARASQWNSGLLYMFARSYPLSNGNAAHNNQDGSVTAQIGLGMISWASRSMSAISVNIVCLSTSARQSSVSLSPRKLTTTSSPHRSLATVPPIPPLRASLSVLGSLERNSFRRRFHSPPSADLNCVAGLPNDFASTAQGDLAIRCKLGRCVEATHQ